jgi:hypothetical protein
MTEIVQGSPEWFAARVGRVTASRVADVIAKTKTGWGASRANYAAELVAERLTGKPARASPTPRCSGAPRSSRRRAPPTSSAPMPR